MEAVHIKEVPAVAAAYLKDSQDKEQWDLSEITCQHLAEQLDMVLERLDRLQGILEEIMEPEGDEDLSANSQDLGLGEECLTDMEEEDDDFAGGSELSQNSQGKE